MESSKTFTNSIDIKPPFTLTIGRKKSVIKKPGQFVIEREHVIFYSSEWNDPIGISQRPARERFQMFVDGKLFATTVPTGTQRPSAHIRLGLRRRIVEIRLIKKYTQIEDAK